MGGAARGARSGRPLRLLVVTSRYIPIFSGTALQLEGILGRLGPDAVDPTVLTLRHPGLSRREKVGGVRVIRVGPGTIQRTSRLLFAIEVFLHVLRHGRSYDVLHGFAAGWAGFLTPLAAQLAGTPSLFTSTLRGSDDAASIRAQKLGRLKLGLMRRYGWITTRTPAQGDSFVGSGFPADRLSTLTCGVDDEFFRPGTDPQCRRRLRRAAGRDDDGPVVLFIGTLTERKGVHILVDAFRRVLPRHPTAVLALMGPASRSEDPTLDEAFVERLRGTGSEPDLDGHVAFLGRITSSAEKRSILQASDVLALFAESEGFGIVVLEAMACGVPPLLAPIPGIFDFIVDDGRDGRIAKRRDVAELSALLGDLLGSEELRRELGRRARRTVEERFAQSRVALEYLALYRRLARRPSA